MELAKENFKVTIIITHVKKNMLLTSEKIFLKITAELGLPEWSSG